MTARAAIGFSNSTSWLARHARAAIGGVIVIGVAVLAAATAAVLAVAVLTVLAILIALGGLLYVFARVRGGAAKSRPGSPRTLEARRTGTGWTVDAVGRFGG